jgi:Leucine-rich repeat (LRR) protein
MGLFELTSLKQLHLKENQFSGTLSSAIGQLTSLRELSLDRSGLSGALPESLGDLIYLEILHLQFNEFNGDVPEALCSVPTLFELEADCDGQGNVDCSCCTQCCSLKAGQCRRTQENRVG